MIKKTALTLFALTAMALLIVFAPAQTPNPPSIQPSGFRSPVVENVFEALNQTASIAATNLQCINPSKNAVSSSPGALIQTSSNVVADGVQCPAGVYRMSIAAETVVAGSGNVTFTPSWHASIGAEGAAGTIAGTLTIASTNIIPSGSAASNSNVFFHDGTTQIQIATTYSSTGTYSLHVILERLN